MLPTRYCIQIIGFCVLNTEIYSIPRCAIIALKRKNNFYIYFRSSRITKMRPAIRNELSAVGLSNDYKKDIFAISAGDSERSRS